MPRQPLGEHAMTDAERQRRRRERLRQENPVRSDRQKLIEARTEIEQLRKRLASATTAAKVKPVKPPLDPESEAARQIAALKKKNKALQQEADKWRHQLQTLVPNPVKNRIAKALNEQTTSRGNRLDALQAWNGLGLNNLGK